MMKEKRPVGRPSIENPLTEAERSKRYRKKKSRFEKEVPFWLSESDRENLTAVMAEAGFTEKEKSEFLSTLLLLLSGKQYLGDAGKFKEIFKRAEQAL